MAAALKKLALAWAASWLFALWSGVCVSIGAAWMLVAILGVLEAKGIHLRWS